MLASSLQPYDNEPSGSPKLRLRADFNSDPHLLASIAILVSLVSQGPVALISSSTLESNEHMNQTVIDADIQSIFKGWR